MPSAIIHFKNLKQLSEKVKCRTNFSNTFTEKRQIEFIENQNNVFQIFGNSNIDSILKSINEKSETLGTHMVNARGVEVGKKSGVIHINKQYNFKSFLRGEDIERYRIKKSVYIDTSLPNIDYKDDTLYHGTKILIRKTGSGINAVIDEEYRYVIQTIYIFKVRPNSNLNLYYILGLINSKLMVF